MDVHTIQIHMNSELDHGKNELIFDDITLEPGTLMTVFHCSVPGITAFEKTIVDIFPKRKKNWFFNFDFLQNFRLR